MLSLHRLPNQIPGEEVIKILRRDFFILFKKVVFFLCLLGVPLILWRFFLIKSFPDLLNGVLSYPLIVLGASAYCLFIWLFFFFSFIDYYLDTWIITSERIINIEQKGFFSRVISEQRLFRIQDVTSEVQGFFPTIFRYGEVYVQTAGSKERFTFKEVPEPDQVRDMIIKLVERSKKRNRNL